MVNDWVPVPNCDGYFVTIDGVVGSNRTTRRRNNFNGEIKIMKQSSKHRKDRGCYAGVGFMINGKREQFRVHKVVMDTFVGKAPAGKQVNHINGNSLDNRLENLEYVTARENTTHYHRSKSAQLGVYKTKSNKYKAIAWNNKKLSYIGVYDTKEQARSAYNKFLKENGLENKYADK